MQGRGGNLGRWAGTGRPPQIPGARAPRRQHDCRAGRESRRPRRGPPPPAAACFSPARRAPSHGAVARPAGRRRAAVTATRRPARVARPGGRGAVPARAGPRRHSLTRLHYFTRSLEGPHTPDRATLVCDSVAPRASARPAPQDPAAHRAQRARNLAASAGGRRALGAAPGASPRPGGAGRRGRARAARLAGWDLMSTVRPSDAADASGEGARRRRKWGGGVALWGCRPARCHGARPVTRPPLFGRTPTYQDRPAPPAAGAERAEAIPPFARAPPPRRRPGGRACGEAGAAGIRPPGGAARPRRRRVPPAAPDPGRASPRRVARRR
jgi:hypothetical protein